MKFNFVLAGTEFSITRASGEKNCFARLRNKTKNITVIQIEHEWYIAEYKMNII